MEGETPCQDESIGEFLQITAGGIVCFARSSLFAASLARSSAMSALAAAGKVKIARLYMGIKVNIGPHPS
jgi:hypothetical protein